MHRRLSQLLVALLALSAALPRAAGNPFKVIRARQCLGKAVPQHLPGTPSYARLRANSYRNNHAFPKLILLPRTEAEVQRAVRCAAAARLQLCVRSGGHSLVGDGLCAGALLDMGNFRRARFVGPGHVLAAGPAVTLGEALHAAYAPRRRWLAAGVCPGVALGGYVLGGGYGPYSATLGLACDALVSAHLVDRSGALLVVSRARHRELFWGLCGGGGAQFGVVTQFRLRTAAARPWDRAVAFRFAWPHARAGEVLERWQRYGEEGGRVWARANLHNAAQGKGFEVYGACFGALSKQACLARLSRAAFFRTPGRRTVLLARTWSALQFHAFLGPDGDWGRKLAPDARAGLLGKRYAQRGEANRYSHQSTFLVLRRRGAPPARAFWQRYADVCAFATQRTSVVWTFCEMTHFGNAVTRGGPRGGGGGGAAFAHRNADIITHFIIGGGSLADRRKAYYRMKAVLKPLTSGVYVNYPEPELGPGEYPAAYWGKSLARLKRLKKRWDPDLLFFDSQPIPRA